MIKKRKKKSGWAKLAGINRIPKELYDKIVDKRTGCIDVKLMDDLMQKI